MKKKIMETAKRNLRFLLPKGILSLLRSLRARTPHDFRQYNYPLLSPSEIKRRFDRAGQKTITLPAIDLLTPYRFDIPAKLIYARLREKGAQCGWGHHIYDEHIRVWNGYFEEDPPKHGLNDFLSSFHATLDSVKKNGFQP